MSESTGRLSTGRLSPTAKGIIGFVVVAVVVVAVALGVFYGLQTKTKNTTFESLHVMVGNKGVEFDGQVAHANKSILVPTDKVIIKYTLKDGVVPPTKIEWEVLTDGKVTGIPSAAQGNLNSYTIPSATFSKNYQFRVRDTKSGSEITSESFGVEPEVFFTGKLGNAGNVTVIDGSTVEMSWNFGPSSLKYTAATWVLEFIDSSKQATQQLFTPFVVTNDANSDDIMVSTQVKVMVNVTGTTTEKFSWRFRTTDLQSKFDLDHEIERTSHHTFNVSSPGNSVPDIPLGPAGTISVETIVPPTDFNILNLLVFNDGSSVSNMNLMPGGLVDLKSTVNFYPTELALSNFTLTYSLNGGEFSNSISLTDFTKDEQHLRIEMKAVLPAISSRNIVFKLTFHSDELVTSRVSTSYTSELDFSWKNPGASVVVSSKSFSGYYDSDLLSATEFAITSTYSLKTSFLYPAFFTVFDRLSEWDIGAPTTVKWGVSTQIDVEPTMFHDVNELAYQDFGPEYPGGDRLGVTWTMYAEEVPVGSYYLWFRVGYGESEESQAVNSAPLSVVHREPVPHFVSIIHASSKEKLYLLDRSEARDSFGTLTPTQLENGLYTSFPHIQYIVSDFNHVGSRFWCQKIMVSTNNKIIPDGQRTGVKINFNWLGTRSASGLCTFTGPLVTLANLNKVPYVYGQLSGPDTSVRLRGLITTPSDCSVAPSEELLTGMIKSQCAVGPMGQQAFMVGLEITRAYLVWQFM